MGSRGVYRLSEPKVCARELELFDASIDVISFASRRDVVGDFEYLQPGGT